MACGQPATRHIKKQFAWQPPWVIITIFLNILIYVILAIVLTKKMTVDVPVCNRHRGYWMKRGILLFGSFVALVLWCFAVGFGLDAAMDRDSAGPIFGVILFSVLAWIVFAIVLQSRAIKAKEITDRTITLVKVHPDFVAAFVGMKDEDFDDEDELPRRPRRREVADSQVEHREAFRETRHFDDQRIRRLDDDD